MSIAAHADHTKSDQLPLCVDLDGTLLLGDSLHESTINAVRADWRSLFNLPAWLIAGKAIFKRRVSEVAPIDPAELTYNEPFLEWLRSQQTAGRTLVLATAADRLIADRVAAHLGVFESVIASDGTNNLKGSNKADRLCERFGHRGFAYAGNDSADLAVWSSAGAAVVVNADPGVARRARAATTVEREFPRPRGQLAALLRAMRPHQWVKNLLCFVSPLAGHMLFNGDALGRVTAMLVAFSLTASGIYLLNDIADLSADRRHPRKRLRPFASGALPISVGLAAAPLLLLTGFAIGLVLGWGSAFVLVAYALASVGYSAGMKRLPLVDVFMLAGLYTLRIVAGAVAAGAGSSNWLLSTSAFFFLGLAFLKRYVELDRVASSANSRRGYVPQDVGMIQTMGIASSFTSCLVLALYISSNPALHYYRQPDLLWGVVALAAFWSCRLWLSAGRGYVHDDPIVYAARDWVSWCVVACSVLVAIAATFGFG